MSDDDKKKSKSAAVFSAPVSGLTKEEIGELKTKYGLSLKLKSDNLIVEQSLNIVANRLGDDGGSPYDRTVYDRPYGQGYTK